jgi:hypothetical protein
MARGNCIVVSQIEQPGAHMEGFVATSQTFYPGMIVQRDASVALKGGRHTYKYYVPGADGKRPVGAYWVVTEKLLAFEGKTINDSYAAGGRVSLYSPLPGDELNLLVGNLSGTADDHALNEVLMVDDGTGKLIVVTGTVESTVAQLMETITDPVADTLAWCQWTGQ